MYGMTPNQFWYDEAELFWAYRTSFLEKQRLEMERTNVSLWLSGIYHLRAMAEVETGGKSKYPREPFDLSGGNVESAEKKEIDLKAENERNIKFMIARSKLALEKQKKSKELI